MGVWIFTAVILVLLVLYPKFRRVFAWITIVTLIAIAAWVWSMQPAVPHVVAEAPRTPLPACADPKEDPRTAFFAECTPRESVPNE
jgi:Mn2+/Fe2+ NRAMP family transporter